MKRGLKLLGIMAVTAGVGLAGNAALANCVEPSGQVYEVRQCALKTWFTPMPVGGGTLTSVQWWAIGFGNATANGLEPATTSGSGMLGTPVASGTFIGVDSGTGDANTLDLTDASVLGIGAPAGALCFSSRANWGSPAADSCIDVNRNTAGGGGSVGVSDNILNPYYYPAPGYGPYYRAQLDPPMGVLLKESTGKFFAAAFFASQNRFKDFNDILPGEYRMAEIVNGQPDGNSGGSSAVPWQPIPQPTISAVLAVPSDPNSNRNLTVTWTPMLFITDNSLRPCMDLGASTPCPSMAPGVTGVGVKDQGPLVHFDLERTTLTSGVCGTSWTTVNSVDQPANPPAQMTMNGSVPPNTCVRLTTRFGRPSCGTGTLSSCFGTITGSLAGNRLKAQTGQFGDLGYSVSSSNTSVGGPLVSQNAVLTVAAKNKNMVQVSWDTTSEVSVTGFDIVGLDARGTKKVVASSVACKQCTTGLGASYTELIQSNKFQGSKKVQIVMQPSGTTSNTLDLN